MFLIGGVEAISAKLDPSLLTLFEGILGFLAIYFRVDQKVDFKK